VGRSVPRPRWDKWAWWRRWPRAGGGRDGIDLRRLIERAEGLNVVVVDTRQVPLGPAAPIPFRARAILPEGGEGETGAGPAARPPGAPPGPAAAAFRPARAGGRGLRHPSARQARPARAARADARRPGAGLRCRGGAAPGQAARSRGLHLPERRDRAAPRAG